MKFKKLATLTMSTAILAGTTGMAQASHFRGAAMIPTITNGILTVESTSFWRKGASNTVSPTIAGVGTMSTISDTTDTTDSRYDIRNTVSTYDVSNVGAQTLDLSWGSCCRVRGINNWTGNSSVSWTMNSSIVWDGTNDTAPILFDFNSVQPEVLRGNAYSDNLGATTGNAGTTLSYTQTLNGIPSQPPGFTVDPATGELTIDASST